MRISNSLTQQRVLRDLQGNLARLAAAQSQVSTGKRFEAMSEDPLAGIQVLGADQGLRAIAQYRRNSTAAQTRIDAEESILGQITDLLTRAKELAIQEGTASSTPQTRAMVKSEIDQILGQVIALGNTQVGNEYVFAGHQTGTVPFDPTGAFFGDAGQRMVEVGQGYTMPANHSGRELLVDSGVITALQQLSTELGTGSPSTIGQVAGSIDAAFDNVQALLAVNGSRARQIESAMQNSDALEATHTQRKSDAQDIDVAAATSRFVSAQNTLQAALLSTSRLLSTSLTDYLR
ncbi:MAG: flagellar hook-associated protein FlgL [Gemmatimonadales bacterium]|nr:flagellar hook-associated protein FlgL [Gemmatimonadales bacterium]